jgi:lipoate-protein ligase A
MALDEMLLIRAAQEGRAHLRIYSWSEPTVSLGYFQRIDQREGHVPSRRCRLVRRPSGGGAIVHDRELTYALAVPGPWGATRQRALYRQVHEALAESLGRLGAEATIAPPSAVSEVVSEPFLCFQRRTEGDVLLQGCKVIGSAQRRGKGAVVQHGSILLKTSEFAPELPGIEDLSTVCLPRDEWVSCIVGCVLRALNFEPDFKPLSEPERAATETLVEQKHGRQEWHARL